MGKKNKLGTRWRFTEYPGPLGVVYGVEAEGSAYRVAPADRPHEDKWRIDKADSFTRMGGPWIAVSSNEFDTAQAAAQELVRLHGSGKLERFAKTASVGVDIFKQAVDPRKFSAIRQTLKKAGDDQSAKLMYDIMQHFMDKFDMNSGEENAWYRLINMVRDGGSWDPALLRNNVFKVANALGMRLPSGMFASTHNVALDQVWGPTLVQG